jgi:hypothetical protein
MGTIFYRCKMFPFKNLGIVFIKIYTYSVMKSIVEKATETGKKLILKTNYKLTLQIRP